MVTQPAAPVVTPPIAPVMAKPAAVVAKPIASIADLIDIPDLFPVPGAPKKQANS
jgi:hypothetical protein